MLPIARTLDCDIVLAKRRPIAMYRRPLIATNLEPALFRRLARTARDALVPGERHIVAVHACHVPYRSFRLLIGAPRLEREIETATRDTLRGLAATTDPPGGFELFACFGDTARVVLDVAGARSCDLIVVGAPRSRLWRRSTLVDHLLTSAECDVAIVRGPS